MDIKEQFIGVWELIEFYCTANDQKWWPMGKNLSGRIFYTENNQLAVHLFNLNASTSTRFGTSVDKYNTDSYASYFGSYAIDAEKAQIVHNVVGHTAQRFWGQKFIRGFKLTGQTLTLVGEDVGIVFTLIWNKLS